MEHSFYENVGQQNLKTHCNLLLDYYTKQGKQRVKLTRPVDELPNLDILLSYREISTPYIWEVECKTDKHQPKNLAVEIITNVPAENLQFPLRFSAASHLADEVIQRARAGEAPGSMGLGALHFGNNHLLSYLFPEVWYLFSTAEVQEAIRTTWNNLDLCCVITTEYGRSWGAISALIPIELLKPIVLLAV